MASNLRSGDRNIYLIGSEHHQITGCKLPSNCQVLSLLFYNLHEVKLSIRESANLVVHECLIFWEKARIPTRATPHCVEKIMKMYNHWHNLQKSACRRSETQEENERNFISDLNNLFDIAHANALEIIKIEDRTFLWSQRELGRRGGLMGINMKLAKREERVLLRVIEQENRRVKAHRSSEIDDNFMDSSEESSGTEDISDQPGPSSNITQSSLEKNINAQIELRTGIVRGRKYFLTPKIMAVLDRFHISQRSAVFILEAVAESLGHNIYELAINRNTIQRYWEDFRKTKATRIKENEPYAFIEMLITDIRKKFRSEYLGLLIQRNEHKKQGREIKLGKVVLIGSDNVKCTDWPLGFVIELLPGKDGVTKLVRLRTFEGELLLPVRRIFPLEVSSSWFKCRQKETKHENSDNEVSSETFRNDTESVTFKKSGRTVKQP
ncbi:hypothetical protein AVEN_242012-1 [Araneus ventricosus]|uniref:DUF5641 domain-containing protein n=1 Tax=Araneus ventricosus TaxID=182803 RepID=A0A4Y2EAG0_ARAVE|nr:hypothetical protein AVEN_242012-1 [Araneus ventricosus]